MIGDWLKRLYDEEDQRGCTRCGGCCMLYPPVGVTSDEAERLGMEFCEPNPGGYRSHRMRKVPRDWAPAWAKAVCVFLYPGDHGYCCMAEDQKPRVCRTYKCQQPSRAAEMHASYLQHVRLATVHPFVAEHTVPMEYLSEAWELRSLMSMWEEKLGDGTLGSKREEVTRLCELVGEHI